jgi:CheY-like chemotaxis protein
MTRSAGVGVIKRDDLSQSNPLLSPPQPPSPRRASAPMILPVLSEHRHRDIKTEPNSPMVPTRRQSDEGSQLQAQQRQNTGISRDGVLPKLKILVAEDNLLNQIVLCSLLSKAGHESIKAGDGSAAVSEFVNHHKMNDPVDLVLMDLLMPVMSGEEAAKLIRLYEREHHLPRTAIIAITAAQDKRALQELVQDSNDPDKLLFVSMSPCSASWSPG